MSNLSFTITTAEYAVLRKLMAAAELRSVSLSDAGDISTLMHSIQSSLRAEDNEVTRVTRREGDDTTIPSIKIDSVREGDKTTVGAARRVVTKRRTD